MTILKSSQINKIGLIISCFIFFTSLNVSAQEINADFLERVEKYQNQNPQELVYLHTDREVYAPGDEINFKAYIRDLYHPSSLSISKNLHIILVDQSGNVQQEKIFQLKNNQSEGGFKLINGLMEGEHSLIGWTDGMETGSAQNVFQKKVFIKERFLPALFINLSAGQTRYLPGDLAQIQVGW